MCDEKQNASLGHGKVKQDELHQLVVTIFSCIRGPFGDVPFCLFWRKSVLELMRGGFSCLSEALVWLC